MMTLNEKVIEIYHDTETGEIKYRLVKSKSTFFELLGCLDVVRMKLANKYNLIAQEPKSVEEATQTKRKPKLKGRLRKELTKERGKKAKRKEFDIHSVKSDVKDDMDD